MAFKYVAYKLSGERLVGTLDVDSEEEAEEALWRLNLIVARLERFRRWPRLHQLLPSFFGVSTQDLAIFTQQLDTLLDSGIPLVTGLRLLQGQASRVALREALDQVIQDIEFGRSFSEACARQPLVFPPVYNSLIAVAEESGELANILHYLSDYLEKQASTLGKVKSALIYPLVVAGVAVVALIVLLTFFFPAMKGLFQEFQTELPLSARLLLGLSDFLTNYGPYLALALGAAIVVGVVYTRTSKGAKLWDHLLWRLPFLGRVIASQRLSHFCLTLAILLSAGLSLARALEVTVRATTSPLLRHALTQVHTSLLTGQRFSSALVEGRLFPPLLVQMVATGEETGSLDKNLKAMAQFYEEAGGRAITRFTGILEPAMILLVGLGVGFVAITVVSTLYGLMQGIG